MGIFDRLFSTRATNEIQEDLHWRPIMSQAVKTRSGVMINENIAMQIAAVFGATRAIAEDMAKLPLPIYRHLPGSNDERERVRDHPVAALLNTAPNGDMSAFDYRQTKTAHLLTWGNAYSEIRADFLGGIKALEILSPERMRLIRRDEELVYVYRPKDAGSEVELPARRVFHLKGLGFDGLLGYSVVRMARESLGVAMAAEQFGAQFFGNGAQAGFVAMHPETLSEEAQKRLKKSIDDKIGGENKFGTLVLEEGIKVEKLTVPPEDAQFLSTRQFGVEEVCRWFRIPPSKLQHLLKANFNTLEMQNQEYVTDTLMAWCVRWEKEIGRKLLDPADTSVYAEHNIDALVRGDIKTRSDAYSKGRQWGWFSVNDIKRKENMPSIGDQGDVYLVPGNMVNAESVVSSGGSQDDEQNAARAATAMHLLGLTRKHDGDKDKANAELQEKIKDACRRGLEDAFARLRRIETDKIRRAGKRDPDGFQAWLVEFLPSHEKHVRDAVLVPVLNLVECLGVLGIKRDLDSMVDGVVSRHIAKTRSDCEVLGPLAPDNWADRCGVQARNDVDIMTGDDSDEE